MSDRSGGFVDQTFSITVTGVNDAAVIFGEVSGTIHEDVFVPAMGALASTNVDGTDNAFVAGSGAATYGNFVVDGAGIWVYFLNNTILEVDGLIPGETLSDSFSVTSEDGMAQAIDITINGATDGPTEFADTLIGTNLDDEIDGLGGGDSIVGRDGYDTLTGGAGADSLGGGTGTDILGYATDATGVTVALWNNTASGGDAAGDVIGGFEGITGGSGND